MQPIVATYREFAPCPALKDHVRAFFSFIPAAQRNPPKRRMTLEVLFGAGDVSFSSPVFADGHASLVFDLGMTCRADGRWLRHPAGCRGKVIGAISKVDPVLVEPQAMIGAYFHAAQAPSFTRVPACELADRIVILEDLWGSPALELSMQLAEMNEAARVDRLEFLLLRRIGDFSVSGSAVNVPRLAASVVQRRGQVTAERLAAEAGVSRQYLARLFRESIGISPKLYCRLARFQSGLVYAGYGKDVDWAGTALDLGYADQSHMIAEFREFSSLTPDMLASKQWFHPFIAHAKSRHGIVSSF